MRSSRGEIRIEEILKENDIVFKEEYIFPELRAENGSPLRFDFAIFDDDEPVQKYGGKQGFYQQKHNDDKKRRFCALNHYKLIEIPYTDEDFITFDYIMEKAGY